MTSIELKAENRLTEYEFSLGLSRKKKDVTCTYQMQYIVRQVSVVEYLMLSELINPTN